MKLKRKIMRKITLFIFLLAFSVVKAQHGQIYSDHTYGKERVIITTSEAVSYTKFLGDSLSFYRISISSSFDGQGENFNLRVPVFNRVGQPIPEGTKLLMLFDDDSVVTLTSVSSTQSYESNDLKLFPFDQSLVEKVKSRKVIAIRVETGYDEGYNEWYDGKEKHWIFNEVFLAQYAAIRERQKNGISLYSNFNKKYFEDLKAGRRNRKTIKHDGKDDMY